MANANIEVVESFFLFSQLYTFLCHKYGSVPIYQRQAFCVNLTYIYRGLICEIICIAVDIKTYQLLICYIHC